MEAYPSESSPPNSVTNLPATPAPAVGNRRAPRGLGGMDKPTTKIYDLLMMQAGAGGSSSNPPPSAQNGANDDSFIVDSGATDHATGNGALFTHLNPMPPPPGTRTTSSMVLRVANDSTLQVHGRGTVQRDNITLHGVLYAPGLTKNIVSVSKLGELGYNVEFTRTSCFIRDAGTGGIVGKGRLVDGLFELEFLEAPRVF